MKFFIDTANLDQIKEINSLGILDGVTTNPSLIAKEGVDLPSRILKICQEVDGPVSAEVISTNANGMIDEGKELATMHPNVVIKCPLTLDGLKATKALSTEGFNVNVTLCFSGTQALMAAKAGAAFISPFVGRLDDLSQSGMDLIADIRQIYDNYGFETEILVASIRSPLHVLEAAKMGADVCTIPYSVIHAMVRHPLTDSGLEKFLKDWQSVSQKQIG